jgi:hypothetical protein
MPYSHSVAPADPSVAPDAATPEAEAAMEEVCLLEPAAAIDPCHGWGKQVARKAEEAFGKYEKDADQVFTLLAEQTAPLLCAAPSRLILLSIRGEFERVPEEGTHPSLRGSLLLAP